MKYKPVVHTDKGKDWEFYCQQKYDTEESYNQIGISLMSNDRCCMLLAFLLVFGGGMEAVTQNNILYTDIQIAQAKMNLNGGEVPEIGLLPRLHQNIKQLTITGEKTDWLPELLAKYKISWRK